MAGRFEDELLLMAVTASEIGHARAALALAEAGGIADALQLSLGARDRALIQLRAAWLGLRMPCVDRCAHCGEKVEFLAPLAALGQPVEEPTLPECGSYSPRLLTTADLLAVEHLPPDAARQALAEAAAGRSLLRPEDAAQIAGWLAAADPMAHVRLDMRCEACGGSWSRPFDIVRLLWQELRALGQRLLHDIHRLALAYHWSEAEILALPRLRRQAYLEMLEP